MKREKKPHRFTHAAPRPVPDDGRTDLPGSGKACTGGVSGLRPAAGLHDQELSALAEAVCDEGEFATGAQALDGEKGLIGGFVRGVAGLVARWGRYQAETRLRPLARRRASTFWPFLVAMRERKPWRRLRFRLLGWKVRLVDTGHAPCSLRKGGELTAKPWQVKNEAEGRKNVGRATV
jgi:hypothetical protein